MKDDNCKYNLLETSSQYLTISVWPCLTARCNGYNPFLLAISTLQPNAQRVCATVSSPSRDARWTDVLPSYNKTILKW